MATNSRHTFSGAVVAGLVAATAVTGWVPTAKADVATSSQLVAPYACPQSWPTLRVGPPSGAYDGNVSVLVGGNLYVVGAAAGAEGTVVSLGSASFARDVPGSYEVGVTTLGSQISPFPGSDMLAVGGVLTTGGGTHVDVGQGMGGDVVVAGAANSTDVDPHGGRVDSLITDATAPYLDLAGRLAPMSAGYAALPPTGDVSVTDDAITLKGDSASSTQVFNVDGATLGKGNGEDAVGRSLQLRDVPQDAIVVINLTGPVVDLDVDSVLAPDGAPVDPMTDGYFTELATHLLWNAPAAVAVDIGGAGELPGSLLVPTAPSTTTLSGLGTNGRVLVAGDLVHTGQGELHAFPFLGDPALGCAADLVHLTDLTLDVQLIDPDRVVDRSQFFDGQFECTLGGQDVTPVDNIWRLRAGGGPRVVSDQIPSGATCTVSEQLDFQPAQMRAWANPILSPDAVVVLKRQQLGFTITNRVKDAPTPSTPTSTPTPTPTATPTSTPTHSTPPPPPPPSSYTPAPAPSPTPTTTIVDPTNRPSPSATPSATPSAEPTATATSTDTSEPNVAEAPRTSGPAGPLTSTAPFTLRGAFVWGPMLMLSLLTLLLRVRRRPKRVH